jgi:hypothetical protein
MRPLTSLHQNRAYAFRSFEHPRRTSAPRALTSTPQSARGPTKLKLDEQTRWQVAGEAVEELRRYGGWKELDEEAPIFGKPQTISDVEFVRGVGAGHSFSGGEVAG